MKKLSAEILLVKQTLAFMRAVRTSMMARGNLELRRATAARIAKLRAELLRLKQKQQKLLLRGVRSLRAARLTPEVSA